MLLNALLLLLLLFKEIYGIASIKLGPRIETQNGAIRGVDVSDKFYYAYKSIPYAEPPIGSLRFEPPVAIGKNWTNTLLATQTAPKCMQWSTIVAVASTDMSEDCLYLNIFVPKKKSEDERDNKLLPIIVFIHGGGFMWGSADFFGERYIMEAGNVILVTLNYRLGPFGFLSTEDDEITGNMGFKDQVLALQWIYENIGYFGGDAQKILLSGWSAGAASVHLHMISDMSNEKWFQSAASFSGSALCPCHAIYAGEALKKSKLMAEYLNCTAEQVSTTKGMKACLQAQEAAAIIRQIPKFYKFFNNPFTIFGPVIDNSTTKPKFLSDQAENLMRAGKSKAKPWLISRTAEDGAFGAAEFLRRDKDGKEFINVLNERWVELAPILLFFNSTLTADEQKTMALLLRQKYFGTCDINTASYSALERLYNEELITKSTNKIIELYVNSSGAGQAYGYVYDNPAPYGFGQALSGRTDWKFGTLHGDDIFLIFNTSVGEQYPLRTDEIKISHNLINMLISMAETGIPIYDGRPLAPLTNENRYSPTYITENGVVDRE